MGAGNQIGSSETAIQGFKHPIISSTLPPTLNLLCRKDKLEFPVILPLPLESRILCVHHRARSLAQGLGRSVNTLVGAAPSPAVLFIPQVPSEYTLIGGFLILFSMAKPSVLVLL